ncbi:MAG TPA: carboxypeptidase regulatory-like domain-containing protein [Terriglobia bacterium]|nr:carboxypeptidase regulatory-like domain-containing protein [Terriglobia bacterium]
MKVRVLFARCFRGFVLCALLVSTWPLIAPAQVSASLSGVTRDPSGAALPGVTLTAKNVESGLVRRVITDEHGRYDLVSLPVGSYEVSVTKSGFRTEARQNIPLAVGQEVTVDWTLQLGEVKQHITVTGETQAVRVTTSETSGLVSERQIKDLPLNGRSYDELLTLNAGVVNFTWEKTGGVGISNSAVGNMFSISGNRPQQNLFLLNGIEFTGAAENNMQPGGASQQLLGVDAVREFNVLRDNYGAEYGKRPGGQVTIVTQSGTNHWHGTLFEFLRNSAFDARNFFDQNSVPHFARNQFGGALGGPIEKDKTFLFGNYEGFRQHLGLSDVTLVPDNNARMGYLPGPGGLANVGIAPGVLPLLSLWPAQSANAPDFGGIAEAFSSPLQTIREDFGTTRLDRIFSPQDSVSAVYTIDDSADFSPTINPYSTDIENLREQVASLEETHVFSPALLDTGRLGFSRASYFYTGEPTPSTPAAGVSSFLAGRPVGAVVIGGSAASNPAAQLSLAGSNNGSNLDIARNLFTFEDVISFTKGRHRISAGAWFQRLQSNENLALSQFGQATFASLTTFLKGTAGSFLFDPAPTPLGWRSLLGAWHAEDIMRVNSRLTVSLGLRDEFTNGWNEASGRGANFVFDDRGIIVTQPRVTKSVFTINRAKFLPQPRIGLAWSPWGAKTVIRAGFGMYNDLQDALGYRLDQNAPFNPTYSIANLPVSQFPFAPGAPAPASAKVSPGGVQPDLRTPAVASWSFKVERELTPNTSFGIEYAGSHGYHEIVSVDANEPGPAICPAAPCPSDLPAGTSFIPSGTPNANPSLANTWSWFSEGVSSYNALLLDFTHRFSRGLSVRGVYTWSKTLDDGDSLNATAAANAPGLVMNPFNIISDWGLATFDVRNVAVINASYELPLGQGKSLLNGLRGWRDALVGGWSMNGVQTLQSGFPFTPQLSFNPSNNGDTRNPVRPSLNPAFTGPVILGSPNRYFNPNAFIVPRNGTYGNVGRDTFIGPGLATLDFSLLKKTRVTEKLALQFRAEFFNLLNHANFNSPNLIVFTSPLAPPSPAAGVITSTSTSSRQIQFGLKLIW